MNIKNQRYAEDQNPPDLACQCMVCRRYTRAYLRHLSMAKEPLAGALNSIHNLSVYLDTMKSVRDAIPLGALPTLLARIRERAGMHAHAPDVS